MTIFQFKKLNIGDKVKYCKTIFTVKCIDYKQGMLLFEETSTLYYDYKQFETCVKKIPNYFNEL